MVRGEVIESGKRITSILALLLLAYAISDRTRQVGGSNPTRVLNHKDQHELPKYTTCAVLFCCALLNRLANLWVIIVVRPIAWNEKYTPMLKGTQPSCNVNEALKKNEFGHRQARREAIRKKL